MVAGFYEPDDGEILLNGKRIERIPPYSRNTAMVFQEYALFPHMNVFDNVSYGLRVKNRPKEEIERRVKEALDLMQLKGPFPEPDVRRTAAACCCGPCPCHES